MITMDVKGVSWVGNICQRFEALCVEVDDMICEDAVKYVGNHMKTVGDNVKKIYSEVMKDLLDSSSLDPVKKVKTLMNVADDVDASMKPKADDRNVSVNAECKKLLKDSDGAASAAGNTVNCESCCSSKQQLRGENSQNQFTELLSSNSDPTVVEALSSRQNLEYTTLSDMPSINASVTKDDGEEVTCQDFCNGQAEILFEWWDDSPEEESIVLDSEEGGKQIAGNVTESYGRGDNIEESRTGITCSGAELAKVDGSISSMKTAGCSTITHDVQNAVGVERRVSTMDTETSNPLLACETKSGNAAKNEVLSYQQLSKLKLEESCVMVEKNDYISTSILKDPPKSYKKKIREVFSPRRWSKNRSGWKQPVWDEEQFEKNMVSTSTSHAEILNSHSSEFLESEWELL